jgi:hypothetical protein
MRSAKKKEKTRKARTGRQEKEEEEAFWGKQKTARSLKVEKKTAGKWKQY